MHLLLHMWELCTKVQLMNIIQYPEKYYLAVDHLASVKFYFHMETYTIYIT